ncbi:amine oxidase [Coniella lustricola]|uniref:Amine oxidase n=1 Tax=Coniella lustricola TaxID=2025994 RepID=A0A2T3A3B6_9PEZI|nr:amine oxidase [Coniella lustricola]
MSAATADQASRHADTLILGAGISGLACASRLLLHQNVKGAHDEGREEGQGQPQRRKVLVLEGRQRIGGRIEAVYLNGCRLDTGANWIHGAGTDERPNPLVRMLHDKRSRELQGSVVFAAPEGNALDGEHVVDAGQGVSEAQPWAKARSWRQTAKQDNDSNDNDNSNSNSITKTRIIPKDIAEKMLGSLWGMVGSLQEAAATTDRTQAKNTTMLQAITKTREFRDVVDAVPKEYHRSLRGMPQFIEGIEAAPLAAPSAEHAAGRAGMSLLEFGIDDFGGEQVFVQDGFAAVVDEMASELVDAGLVRLGVVVQKVDWRQKPIRVETSEGVYTADEVVCTLPLGVLQHHCQSSNSHDNRGPISSRTPPPPSSSSSPPPSSSPSPSSSSSFFEPPLPASKQTAINSLGFGTLDKIMLVYSSPWWTEEPFLSFFHDGLVGGPSLTNPEPPSPGAAAAVDSTGQDNSTIPKHSPDSFFGFTTELPGLAVQQDGTATAGPRALTLINLHNLTGFPVLSAFVSCANAVQVEALSNEQAGHLVHRVLTSWLGGRANNSPPLPTPEAVHVSRWAHDEFSRGSYSHMITGLSETAHRHEFQRPVVGTDGAVLRFAGEHTSGNHFATVHGALLSGWREADAILKGAPEAD